MKQEFWNRKIAKELIIVLVIFLAVIVSSKIADFVPYKDMISVESDEFMFYVEKGDPINLMLNEYETMSCDGERCKMIKEALKK